MAAPRRPPWPSSEPVLGVDGCKAGWVGAVRSPGERAVRLLLAPDIVELVALARRDHGVRVVGIDIPIGLPDRTTRAADVLARRALPGKASSIFTTLTRAAYEAPDRLAADAVNRTLSGQGVGAQAFAIAPKIREVDAWVRDPGPSGAPALGVEVIEVHPEVSFAAMTGAPLLPGKRTAQGRDLRLAALAAVGIDVDLEAARALRGAAPDDVLDACAVSWTAARHAAGLSERLPDPPEVFGDGLIAAIHR